MKNRSDQEWKRLGSIAELAPLVEDARHQTLLGRQQRATEIDQALTEWTQRQEAYALVEALQDLGLAAGVVQNAEDQYLNDPHLSARGAFEKIPHLEKGEVTAVGIPLGLTGTPGRTTRAGAKMGEDNVRVFQNLLGLSEKEYADYLDAGAIEEGEEPSSPL